MAHETVYQFYIQNYRDSSGEIVTTETLFMTIPMTEDPVITNPKVKCEIGKAGSFEFAMEINSPFYNSLIQMKTMMRVTYFGKTIFRGRVLTIGKSFARSRSVHCEGDFSFFMDSHQIGTKEETRQEIDVYTYLTSIIDKHNSDMEGDPSKQFVLGEVPGHYSNSIPNDMRVNIPSEKAYQQFGDTGWNTSMDRLEGLLSDFGGYYRTRYEVVNGTPIVYLDWFDHYFNSTTRAQKVEITKNLIDLSGSTEVENLFTIVVPIGKSSSDNVFISDYWPIAQPGHSKVNYITVPELVNLCSTAELTKNYHSVSDYQNAINLHGKIWKTVDFSNATTPEKLFAYAVDWMKNNYIPEMTQWDVSALDLRVIENQNDALYAGDRVDLIHPEIGDKYQGLTIISVDYDPFSPDKTKYTIGIPNQQINAAYGVKQKTESAKASSESKSKGSGYTPKPKRKDDVPPGESDGTEAIIANLKSQYWNKTESGKDIQIDDPLAFLRYNPDLSERTEEEIKKDTAKYGAILDRERKTIEQYNPTLLAQIREEAKRRGVSMSDIQLWMDMVPNSQLKAEQTKFKGETKGRLISLYGFTQEQAEVLVNETAGQSWLASLVDDNGNWTDKAGHIKEEPEAETIRQQAIRVRKELSGKGGLSRATSIITGAFNDIIGGNITIDNIFSAGTTSLTDIFGAAESLLGGDPGGGLQSIIDSFIGGTPLADIKTALSGLFETNGVDLSGLISGGIENLEPSVQALLSFLGLTGGDVGDDGSVKSFTLQSGSTLIDGGSGSAGFGKDKNGNWTMRLNAPITYIGQDGQPHTVGGKGVISAQDFALPEIDSFKTKFAVIDEAVIGVAEIGQATIHELRAFESLLGTFHQKQAIDPVTEQPVVDEHGNPVYETDAHGNPVYEGTAASTVNGITNVVGKFSIDQNGHITIESGGGIEISDGSTSVGLWDKGELTGGLMARMINGQTETKIRGDRVVLGSDENSTVTIDGLLGISSSGALWVKSQALFSSIENGKSVSIQNGKLTADNGIAISAGSSLIFESSSDDSDPNASSGFSLGYSTAIGLVNSVKIANNADGTSELFFRTAGTSSYTDNPTSASHSGWFSAGTFSRATSLNPVWSGNSASGKLLTITTSPAATASYKVGFNPSDDPNLLIGVDTNVSQEHPITQNPLNNKTLIVPVSISSIELGESEDENVYESLLDTTVSVDGTLCFNSGWDDAADDVDLPDAITGSSESPTMTLLYPLKVSSSRREQRSAEYRLRVTKNDAYISIYGDNDTVSNYAHVVHGMYNDGWDDAADDVDLPDAITGSSESLTMTLLYPLKVSNSRREQRSAEYRLRVTKNDAYISMYGDNDSVSNYAHTAHGMYNSGWQAAYAKVSVPGSTGSNSYIDLAWPTNVVDSDPATRRYELAESGTNKFILRYNDSTTATPRWIIVAEKSHNQYTSGQTNGKGLMGVVADAENQVVKVVEGTTKQLVISATVPTFTYDSTGHFYRAAATAKAGDTPMHTATTLGDAHSGTQAYTDGWGNAYAKVSIPADLASSSTSLTPTISIGTPKSSPNSTADSNTYTIQNDGDDNVVLKHNETASSSVAYVAKFKHGKYTSGKKAATVTMDSFTLDTLPATTNYTGVTSRTITAHAHNTDNSNNNKMKDTILSLHKDQTNGLIIILKQDGNAIAQIKATAPDPKVSYDDAYVISANKTAKVIKGVKSGGSDYLALNLNIGTAPSDTNRTRTVSLEVGGDAKITEVLSDYSNGYNSGYDDVSAPEFVKWNTSNGQAPTSNLLSNTITFNTDNKLDPTLSASQRKREGTRSVWLTQGGWNNHKTSVYLRDNGSSGMFIGRIEVDASDEYSGGKNTMGVVADAENQVVKVVEGTTKQLPITATEPEFTYDPTGHYYRATVQALAGDTPIHTVTSISNSGTQAYDDGFNAVSSPSFSKWAISGTVQAPTVDWTHNTITFVTDSKTDPTLTDEQKVRSGSRKIYLTQGASWSDTHKKSVYMRDNDSSGLFIGRIEVNATSEYNAGFNAVSSPSFSSWSTAGAAQAPTSNITSNTIVFATDNKIGSGSTPRTGLRTIHLTQSASWSGHKKSVYMRDDTSSGLFVGRIEVDASIEYSSGQDNVTINKGAWDVGKIDFTKSAGTASTKSVSLDAADAVWNGNMATVDIYDGDPDNSGVNTGFSVEVDATARYNAGNAHRGSRINGFAQSTETTSNLLQADKVYELTSEYTDANGNWKTGGKYYIKTPSGGSVTWPSAISRISSTPSETQSATFTANGTTKKYTIDIGDFYNAQGQTVNAARLTNGGNVVAALDINGLLINMFVAGENNIKNAGGEYPVSSNGDFTLNQYVTILHVGVSGSHSPSISSGDIWTTDRTLSGWTRADTLKSKYEQAKRDSEYVAFKVKCGGEEHVYYMEP